MENINQELAKRIQAIPVPEKYKNINIGYIPLGKGVIIEKETEKGLTQTSGGILVPVVKSNFVSQGRIVALGPLCSEYLKLGLLVKYNSMTDITTEINNNHYVINSEISIEGIIEDIKSVSIKFEGPSAKEVRREEKASENRRVISTLRKDAKNKEDEYEEKIKDKRKNPITSKYK